MSERIAISRCQRGLFLVWFAFFIMNLALMVALSLHPGFGEKTQEVWSWFVPNILPMLLLIVGSFAAGALSPGPKITVHPFVYGISKWLSLLYLLLLFVTVLLLNSFIGARGPIEIAKLSTYWLAPVQSLANLALGIFFGSPRA